MHFRIRAGDQPLAECINKSKKNATYQSPDIQNQLIGTADSIVNKKAASKSRAATFWSIIANETTDRQQRELLAVVFRCIYEKNGKWLCAEDTVTVIDAFKLAGDDNKTDEELRLSYGVVIEQILLTMSKNWDWIY